MKTFRKIKHRAGFTLAEILLAMMVFAIAITTILGLLARSIETADSILVKDEAIGLSSAVDSYMSELDFREAYDLVVNAAPTGGYLYAYRYRAYPSAVRTDGTLNAYPDLKDTDQLGTDYVVVSGVRPPGDARLADDVDSRDGRIFQVHLSVPDANPFSGTLPSDPDQMSGSTGFPAYDEAVLVIYAEFYQVNGVGAKLNTSSVTPDFSFNFAVRR